MKPCPKTLDECGDIQHPTHCTGADRTPDADAIAAWNHRAGEVSREPSDPSEGERAKTLSMMLGGELGDAIANNVQDAMIVRDALRARQVSGVTPQTTTLPDRDLWDSLPLVAEALKAHRPESHEIPREIRCACGLAFGFVDAKAWHRHAAAMVMNVLALLPTIAAPRNEQEK